MKIPYTIKNRLKLLSPAFKTSVAVFFSIDGGRQHPALAVRVARAVGMVCDSVGKVDRAYVFIGEGEGVSVSTGKGDELVIRTGLSYINKAGDFQELSDRIYNYVTEPGSGKESELEKLIGSFPHRLLKGHPDSSDFKVLLFENLYSDPDVEGGGESYLTCGSFQIASSLRAMGYDVLMIRGKLDAKKIFSSPDRLKHLLAWHHPRLVCITLLEKPFKEIKLLCRFIKDHCNCFIAVGGPMPTISPEHVAVHLPEADFIVRGDGEEIICDVAGVSEYLTSGGEVNVNFLRYVLSLEGMFFRTKSFFLASHPAYLNEVRSLDATAFDPFVYSDENLAGGVSLETSRGCIHPCTFCVTYSRGGFRTYSPDGIRMRLTALRQRLEEAGRVKSSEKFTVHIPDDDFSCDPLRVAKLIREIRSQDFVISSFQASVRDFFLQRGGEKVMVDDFIQSLTPSIFRDGRYYLESLNSLPSGRRDRKFNSFIKLGVESFCDEELGRLGKGYGLEDVRRVVSALTQRGIVHDAYYIFANRKTTVLNIVDSFMEIAKLKIDNPYTFFVRAPVVGWLVTTFVSPAFRIWMNERAARSPEGAVMVEQIEEDFKIAYWLRADGFGEFDYPVIERDIVVDPDVEYCAGKVNEIFERDSMYFRPLENLRAVLMKRLEKLDVSDDESDVWKLASRRDLNLRMAVRRLHDAAKLIILEKIKSRREEGEERGVQRYCNVLSSLSPGSSSKQLLRQLKNYFEGGDPRLVIIPTRDCSLRCRYCPMIKYEGRVMSISTCIRAIELLLSSRRRSLIFQFFGGEALLRKDFVLEAMDVALWMAERANRKVGFIISTNGIALDEKLVDIFSKMPVKVEVSIDGTEDVHLSHRVGKCPDINSYRKIVEITPHLLDSGLVVDAIMVVTPTTVGRLFDSFSHVVSLGYKRIQINPALGVIWNVEQKQMLADGLHEIEKFYFKESVRPDGVEFIDLWSYRKPVLLNCEITVDYDGNIYYGNGFLVKTANASAFYAGCIEDMEGFDSYMIRKPDNDYLLENTYPGDVMRNNIEVGRIMGSFVRHVRKRFPDEFANIKSTTAPQLPAHRW